MKRNNGKVVYVPPAAASNRSRLRSIARQYRHNVFVEFYDDELALGLSVSDPADLKRSEQRYVDDHLIAYYIKKTKRLYFVGGQYGSAETNRIYPPPPKQNGNSPFRMSWSELFN